MQKRMPYFCFLLLFGFCAPLKSQFLNFNDATSQWSPMGIDPLEKDIAVGDLNQDGLDDIVIVRKTPFSNPGAGADVLLMNTGSNLEDQTALFAPEFISNPSDSRDVFIGNFTDDDWPDVVIANTFEDQPIFYHNLGNDANGNWLGLADETSTRFPVVLPNNVLQFCALWAGDVTGNGALDIYFSNYDPDGASLDVLLINDGNGFFTDETDSRLGNLRRSAFGTSAEIHDMDNDGDNDIIKISTLFEVSPWFQQGVFILFNEGEGTFSNWMFVPSEAPYMFTVADFNEDGMKDIYVVDDDADYINFATAISPDNGITYQTSVIPDPRANFFGGNVKLADLDNNGYLDIGLADVDVDIPPCESGFGSPRKFTLMQNTTGTITAPYGLDYYPWNESTYDFAFIDLNQDSLPDLFLGRCDGYEVFLNSASSEDCTIAIQGNVQICEDSTSTLSASLAAGGYLWSTGDTLQSISITTSGIYCVTVTDTVGCSDATCLEVNFGSSSETILDAIICQGASYPIGSESFTEAGTYEVILANTAGCDSMIILNLEVLEQFETTIATEICVGDSISIGDEVFAETGEYEILFTANNGCDSSVYLNLTALAIPPTVFDATICEGDSIEIAGTFYQQEGAYELVLASEEGCDSILNINLTVDETAASSLDFLLCAGDTLMVEDQVFDEAGMYEVVTMAANGCDSLISINLDFAPEIVVLDTMTIGVLDVPGEILVELLGGVEPLSYLWSNGDTTQNLMTFYPGNYTLTVTDANGCMVEFSFFLPQIVSVQSDPLFSFEWLAFPNPSAGQVSFQLTNPPAADFRLIVYDVLGRKVHESMRSGETFELQLPAASGTYFYQLNFGQGAIFSGRLVKQD